MRQRFLQWIREGTDTKDIAPVNRYDGSQSNGAV